MQTLSDKSAPLRPAASLFDAVLVLQQGHLQLLLKSAKATGTLHAVYKGCKCNVQPWRFGEAACVIHAFSLQTSACALDL